MSEKEEFIRQFREVNPKFSRFYACFLTHTNLTLSQYALLNHLSNSGVIPMTELAVKLHISKPAVTHLVDQLEKKKYLKRAAHPKDRRISLIEALPKGEKIVRDMQSYILNFLLKTLDQFSSQEKKTIREFYARLSRTMDMVLARAGGKKK
ncbi:MAG: MarR family transcriptional regulator [Candidatus Omnitrophica bacterium]|nr:MarR family transcriptional regulator [Candidatus Omnitrophota bacterium]